MRLSTSEGEGKGRLHEVGLQWLPFTKMRTIRNGHYSAP